MIHIVGGTYWENCLEPPWNNLFGSGGRAASALSHLNEAVYLTTYVGENEKQRLKHLATTLDFQLGDIKLTPQTISFNYHHCLSDPLIEPPISQIAKNSTLSVNAQNIIRYGFLEGDAIVHGEKVTYDPQNEYNSELFRANGSTAEKLAIIANINECQKLTDSPRDLFDAETLGNKLREKEAADIVVVKQGSLGALVITASEIQSVPIYQTTRVFSIGSGDIFTAVFAHFWGSSNKNPFESAHLASLATAYYCDTRRLPLPVDFKTLASYQPIERKNEFPDKPKQIYLAGPFFSMAERWMIDEARKYLRAEGFNVFSPFHDVGYGKAEKVASADIDGLIKSDIVFAILDNLDSGTIFEIRCLIKQFAQNAGEQLGIFAG